MSTLFLSILDERMQDEQAYNIKELIDQCLPTQDGFESYIFSVSILYFYTLFKNYYIAIYILHVLSI